MRQACGQPGCRKASCDTGGSCRPGAEPLNEPDEDPRASSGSKHLVIATASIGIALAVMGIKYIAFLMTGSVALYSDALESIVNVLTAGAALIAIRIGSQPARRATPSGTTRPSTSRPCSKAR